MCLVQNLAPCECTVHGRDYVVGGSVTRWVRQGLWNHHSQLIGLRPLASASVQLHFLTLK